MNSVEKEYKMTKIKSAIRLYSNEDSTMSLVWAFEENGAYQGHQSIVKEARMFAKELGIILDLSFLHPKCCDSTDGADIPRGKIKRHLKNAALEQWKTEVKEKRWQGTPLAARWLKNWDRVPTHTIAGMLERYEQLTLSKVYHTCKTHINQPNDTLSRLCGKTA